MKKRAVTAILLLVIFLLPPIAYRHYAITERQAPLFFGVSFGGKTVNEAKLLVDKVKGYTNFILINSWDISTNQTALNEVCNYAAHSDLSFIVFFDFISLDPVHGYPWHSNWTLAANEKWGEKFLGIYIYEEPGGKQIDTGLFDEFTHSRLDVPERFKNASSYSEASEIFVTELPKGIDFEFLVNNGIKRFTSDYALFWFDYLAGYDTLFVELGWNHSRAQQIGLCRGAANLQGKEWGAIVTWTYDEPPYMARGARVLQDMIDAYKAGARYIVVFNFPTYPEGNPYGLLREEHFEAMQQFWTYVGQHPEACGREAGQVAFVLPKDYGWGMRWPDDSIWGLWPSDDLSPEIWTETNRLIGKYGLRLDIVYSDARFSYEEYPNVYYWNTAAN